MYHGEVNIAQGSLNSFLSAAEELAVKGLTANDNSAANLTAATASPAEEVPVSLKSVLIRAVFFFFFFFCGTFHNIFKLGRPYLFLHRYQWKKLPKPPCGKNHCRELLPVLLDKFWAQPLSNTIILLKYMLLLLLCYVTMLCYYPL